MNMKRIMRSLVLYLTLLVALAACGGGGGSSGDTVNKGNSVVSAASKAAPLDACPSGGIQVETGIDENGNGILDPAEVDITQNVCNGANGTNGLSVLVSVATEAAGASCANGGKKVSVGLDTNGNSILDSAEITSSDNICNGTNGINGLNSLSAIVSEAAGAICPSGGLQLTSGLDLNLNGALDSGEVSSTNYVCNGATGPAGPGVTWVDVTGTSVQAASNTGYLANNAAEVTVILPPTPAVGDIVQVSGIGSGGWTIAQNAGQSVITKNLPGGIGALWTAHESPRVHLSVASSADGTKLVVVVNGGQIYTSVDSGAAWTARDASRQWTSVASSSDGAKLVATVFNGQIYTSTDSGVTWTARDAARGWTSVASSSDGTNLVAAENVGQIYTSTDSGVTWTARDAVRNWNSVASSADGTRLVAAEFGGLIYTSVDAGLTWTPQAAVRDWYAVTSSSDGTKLAAVVYGGLIYTSTDSGETWFARNTNRNWISVASSSDGTRLIAGVDFGFIYTSTDSGVTWTARAADADRGWSGVASSSDGSKLAAVDYLDGLIWTSSPRTTIGTAGSISGGQYDAIELQYAGSNTFTVLSYTGSFEVQ
jgi:hypothetical protein